MGLLQQGVSLALVPVPTNSTKELNGFPLTLRLAGHEKVDRASCFTSEINASSSANMDREGSFLQDDCPSLAIGLRQQCDIW